MWVRTLCPFSSSTRNIALGRGSTTVPSTSIASFFATCGDQLHSGLEGFRHRNTPRPVAPGPTGKYTSVPRERPPRPLETRNRRSGGLFGLVDAARRGPSRQAVAVARDPGVDTLAEGRQGPAVDRRPHGPPQS